MPIKPRIQHLSRRNKLAHALWGVVWLLLYRPSPVPLHGWRRGLLRLFGAKMGRGTHPYPSAKIWAPWNLEMGEHSCLSHHVDCYCVDRITLGDRVWITADVFVAPGVTIGAGAVVIARSSVFHDLEPWTVAGGNPARSIKPRRFDPA